MEPADLKHQRWSTRLYIILLSLSLFILTLYSSLNIETKTVQINNPLLDVVEKLQMRTSSLQCPCTKLSVPYEHLVQLEPRYHQVCSSEFITPEWIDALTRLNFYLPHQATFFFLMVDFRLMAPGIFQILKSMCDLTNDTVVNALIQFKKTQFVSAQLLESDLFLKQMNLTIQQFQKSLSNNLLYLLQLTRNVTYMNQFLSGSFSNFRVFFSADNLLTQPINTFAVRDRLIEQPNGKLEVCSCANNISCGQQAAIYRPNFVDNSRNPYYIPNFYVRCFPIESLIQSTLECFYNNHPCLHIIGNSTNQPLFTNITRLDASRPSNFPINTSVGDLLEQLFIDSWLVNPSYPAYFAECKPILCFYTVTERSSRLEIVTTVTGLIGGLSTILKILSPYIVSACVYFLGRRWRLARNSVTQPGQLRITLISKHSVVRELSFHKAIFWITKK